MNGNTNRHLTIPIDLIRYVIQNKCERCFGIYLYLKFVSNGIFHKKNLPLDGIKEHLGIRDRRTIKKYIQDLIKKDWIGYNKGSGNFFIRGFNHLRENLALKTRIGAICNFSDLPEIKSYLFASAITFDLNRQKMIQNRVMKKFGVKATALKRLGALQLPSPYFLRPYFGLSNEGLGKVVGCRKSQASRLKIKAKKCGYLKVIKKLKFIKELKKPDHFLKTNSLNGHKMVFKKGKDGKLMVFEQLHDEIIPLISLKIIKRASAKLGNI